ncbi:MAG: ABC transporter substrate-binding protein [Ilumatobacter sp.]
MNTTRRSHKLLAAATASALVLAACGSDDDAADEESETTEAEADASDDGDDDEAMEEDDAMEEEAEEPAEEEEAEEPAEEEPAAEGSDGGTLIWAHEQEPPDLHLDDPANNLSIASYLRTPLIEGLYGVSGATEYYPELLAAEAELTVADDGSATAVYTLRDGLMWSDGTPLTTADVEFTLNAILATDGEDEEGNPAYVYLIGDLTGLDTITDISVNSETEIAITWSEFFAGWKGVGTAIYPAHQFDADPATAAAELNDALREWTAPSGDVIASSGPMIFDSWEKGVQMNMVRNDNYHGSTSPDAKNDGVAFVDGVQVNFVTDTDAQINALEAGEAQIIFTQPQLAFEDLASSDDFTVASSAGPVFEHWGLNVNNVHLSKPAVREALAFAMDKTEVMAGLYTPLFGDSLPAEGLGNTMWLSNQSPYVNHAGDAGYGAGDIASAQAALESAGYAQNGDGIYEHPEDGALSLRVGTTGGNRLREIQQELIQAQMSDAGIEIVIDNVEGAAYFGEVPFSEDAIACALSGGAEGNCEIWDITQFAWVGGPWPGGQLAAYRSDSGNNPYGFQNAEFDALADECDATVDDAERADCYNVIDQYTTTLTQDAENGLFMLPLTQKPSFYGFTSDLSQAGTAPDANVAGPLDQVQDFQFAS